MARNMLQQLHGVGRTMGQENVLSERLIPAVLDVVGSFNSQGSAFISQ